MSGQRMKRTRSSTSRHDALIVPLAGPSRARGHSRKGSNATTITSRSTVSPTKRAHVGPGRMVRKSILGGHVQTMTVHQRAEMLAGVAGDCLGKVLAAGLIGDDASADEAQTTWDTLQSMRRTYLFANDAPSIVLFPEFVHHLPNYSPASSSDLGRALQLCNLSSLAYMILYPDKAAKLGPAMASKSKERLSHAERTKRRNAVFVDAWEKYWMIIPEDQKDKEEALRMWLDFATQIVIHYQSITIDPSSGPDATLAGPSDAVWKDIFDPGAVARFGGWPFPGTQSSDASGFDGMTQEIVENRWAKAMAIRSKELTRLRVETLIKRYPFADFRKNFFAYLDSVLADSGAYLNMAEPEHAIASASETEVESSAAESAFRAVIRRRSRSHTRRSSGRHDRPSIHSGVLGEDTEAGALGDADEDTDMDAAEASLGEGSQGEGIEAEETDQEADGDMFDPDMFADVIREMEQEAFQARGGNEAGGALSAPTESEQRIQRSRSRTVTPNKRRRADEDDEEWEIRQGATPRALTQAQAEAKAFTFAARQGTAERIEWDSQTPGRPRATSRPGSRAASALRSPAPSRSRSASRQAQTPRARIDAVIPDSDATPRASAAPVAVSNKEYKESPRMGQLARARPRSARTPFALRDASVPLMEDITEEESQAQGRDEISSGESEDGNEILPPEVLTEHVAPVVSTAAIASVDDEAEDEEPEESVDDTGEDDRASQAFKAELTASEESDEDEDGNELLPPEIRARTGSATEVLPQSAGASASAGPEDNSDEFDEMQVIEEVELLEDEDGNELLPLEIRHSDTTGRQPTEGDAAPADVGDETADDELLPPDAPTSTHAERIATTERDDEMDDNDLLPPELLEPTVTSDLQPTAEVEEQVEDEEMDGNELLPMEALSAAQIPAVAAIPATPTIPRSQHQPYALPTPPQSDLNIDSGNEAEQRPETHRERKVTSGRHARQQSVRANVQPSDEDISRARPTTKIYPALPTAPDQSQTHTNLPAAQDLGALDLDIGGHDYQIDDQVEQLDPELIEPDRRPPASQYQLLSSRARVQDADGFAEMDGDDEEEERRLLQEIDQRRAEQRPESPLMTIEEADINPDPALMQYVPLAPLDHYLYDEHGGPLDPNDEYRVPLGHKPLPSRLHGRTGGHLSAYSRLSGRRRWTEAEALLLYRTVQKVPMDEFYPLKVVWYLHGEHGIHSQDLEDFNPQHMKDKMVTILNTRYNNSLPIEGRARMYLSKENPLRMQYEEDLEEFKAEMKRQDRERRRELDRIEAERLAELEALEAEEAPRREAERKAKKAAAKKKARRHAARRKRGEDSETAEDEESDVDDAGADAREGQGQGADADEELEGEGGEDEADGAASGEPPGSSKRPRHGQPSTAGRKEKTTSGKKSASDSGTARKKQSRPAKVGKKTVQFEEDDQVEDSNEDSNEDELAPRAKQRQKEKRSGSKKQAAPSREIAESSAAEGEDASEPESEEGATDPRATRKRSRQLVPVVLITPRRPTTRTSRSRSADAPTQTLVPESQPIAAPKRQTAKRTQPAQTKMKVAARPGAKAGAKGSAESRPRERSSADEEVVPESSGFAPPASGGTGEVERTEADEALVELGLPEMDALEDDEGDEDEEQEEQEEQEHGESGAPEPARAQVAAARGNDDVVPKTESDEEIDEDELHRMAAAAVRERQIKQKVMGE